MEDEIPSACKRPGCNGKVYMDKSSGSVTLQLARRIESEEYVDYDVDVWCEICAGCTNDLADWWLLGKK